MGGRFPWRFPQEPKVGSTSPPLHLFVDSVPRSRRSGFAVRRSYGGSDYVANESWTLPQGARDFEAYVNCSTDRSSPTCNFADAVSVPALSNVALTLSENVPPSLSTTSGTLLASASSGGSVTGAQSVGFGVADADSGVLSATLRLNPKGGGTSYSHEFSFAPSCEYTPARDWTLHGPFKRDRQRPSFSQAFDRQRDARGN